MDNFAGAYKATNHLIELGHLDIRIMLTDLDMQEAANRYEGYKKAHEDAGIKVQENMVSTGDYSQQNGYNTMVRWIKERDDLTAVFYTSDTLAMGGTASV